MLQYRRYLFSFVFAGDLSGSLRLALTCRTLSISGQSLRSDQLSSQAMIIVSQPTSGW